MADRFPELREEQADAAADAHLADQERDEFERQLSQERLGQFRQDRKERKLYAKRIFKLVVLWLIVVISLLFAQGFLGPLEMFSLADSVLIATATTTTASVTALLVVVARYLFPQSGSASRSPADSETR